MNSMRYTVIVICCISVNMFCADYKTSRGPGFSILNKSNKPINIIVDNNNKLNINKHTKITAAYGQKNNKLTAAPFIENKTSIKEKFGQVFLGKETEEFFSPRQDHEREQRQKAGLEEENTRRYILHKNNLFQNQNINWESYPTTVSIFDRSDNLLYQAEFPAGKTIYVHWNGKDLYPQTGPLRGFQGTTDIGYYLDKNLRNDDITVIFRR
jgi:hypothetical protein